MSLSLSLSIAPAILAAASPTSRRTATHLPNFQSRSKKTISSLVMEGTNSKTAAEIGVFLSKRPYEPPSWASHLSPIPSHTYSLAHLPTPIHKWNLPNLPENTEVWIKRDDLSGMQLSGNKVRKLEFLMADAVEKGADCIITVGGIQSNHCRATAVAARYLNLDSYLILRTSKVLADKDPGLTGNLLVERLVGAHVELVSKEEYAKIGSVEFKTFLGTQLETENHLSTYIIRGLVLGRFYTIRTSTQNLAELLKKRLTSEGRKPYIIPVGGSNSLGTWGYIEAIQEIEQQTLTSYNQLQFDDIVVACGSGGTIAGLSLGSTLSSLKSKVHAFSVCDDPDYFYDFVQGLIDGLHAGTDSHDIVNIIDAKGLGYAMNTVEELKFVKDIATATGVVLDPVYSGKAVYGMLRDMAENPKNWKGRKVLFIHTGGLLGLYDKSDQMVSMMEGKWRKMDLDETVPRKDGTGKMF